MTTIQEFDFSVNLLQAILWQYNDAARLQALLQQKQDWYTVHQTQFWNDWYRDVFNLQTANEFGLSVWSIILDIPIIVVLDPPEDQQAWGFEDTHLNFGHGNFRRQGNAAQKLTAEQARTVLRLRYFQITSRGTVPEINRFLGILFKNYGLAYVLDGHDMTMTYVFTFIPSAQLRFVFDSYDILPRPAGVDVSYTVLTETPFGFDQFNENFDNGNFRE